MVFLLGKLYDIMTLFSGIFVLLLLVGIIICIIIGNIYRYSILFIFIFSKCYHGVYDSWVPQFYYKYFISYDLFICFKWNINCTIRN